MGNDAADWSLSISTVLDNINNITNNITNNMAKAPTSDGKSKMVNDGFEWIDFFFLRPEMNFFFTHN